MQSSDGKKLNGTMDTNGLEWESNKTSVKRKALFKAFQTRYWCKRVIKSFAVFIYVAIYWIFRTVIFDCVAFSCSPRNWGLEDGSSKIYGLERVSHNSSTVRRTILGLESFLKTQIKIDQTFIHSYLFLMGF